MCKKERAERGVALEHAVILTEFTPSWCRYPLIRFLEANGYDVAYTTCVMLPTAQTNLMDTSSSFRLGTTSTGPAPNVDPSQKLAITVSTSRFCRGMKCTGRRGAMTSSFGLTHSDLRTPVVLLILPGCLVR
jgi:hypothetical protein